MFEPALQSAISQHGEEEHLLVTLQTTVTHQSLCDLGRHFLTYERGMRIRGTYGRWSRESSLVRTGDDMNDREAGSVWDATFGALALLSETATARALVGSRLSGEYVDQLVDMDVDASSPPTPSSPIPAAFPPSLHGEQWISPLVLENTLHGHAVEPSSVTGRPLFQFNQMAAQRGLSVQKKHFSRGPDHQRLWSARLYINDLPDPVGEGIDQRTKKEAESVAAMMAMRSLGWIDSEVHVERAWSSLDDFERYCNIHEISLIEYDWLCFRYTAVDVPYSRARIGRARGFPCFRRMAREKPGTMQRQSP
ncbi:hypothetical protein CALCODRAFT_506072 [Calocera cornea HHB12733]|uniref:DRBM domain-containing protein n=1 Tax=Calocera cornea HHB12733 TaxID=1353952 RepID=A0A165JEU8_9BASI|nr:hypothetical protein CALCODRAFT_506072 [Calocera cornea HHB12733]